MPKTPLKQLREQRQLTQKDVAAALGLSQSRYSRIERSGETTKETAQAIVAFFGRASGITELEVLYPERYGLHRRAGEVAA